MKVLLTGLLLLSLLICSCTHSAQPPLATVTNFSPEKYAGKWHEVARLPNFFERGVVAAKATYAVRPDGKISVYNEGLRTNGKRTSIRGVATVIGNTPIGEAKLGVRFHRFPASLFTGDYWILDLNDTHTRAIVGSPNRKFLWLLAKDPNNTADDFSLGIKRMKEVGFAIEGLIHNPRRIK